MLLFNEIAHHCAWSFVGFHTRKVPFLHQTLRQGRLFSTQVQARDEEGMDLRQEDKFQAAAPRLHSSPVITVLTALRCFQGGDQGDY